jgi:hypothetical protein
MSQHHHVGIGHAIRVARADHYWDPISWCCQLHRPGHHLLPGGPHSAQCCWRLSRAENEAGRDSVLRPQRTERGTRVCRADLECSCDVPPGSVTWNAHRNTGGRPSRGGFPRAATSLRRAISVRSGGHYTYRQLRRTFRLSGGATPVYEMPAVFRSRNERMRSIRCVEKCRGLTLTQEGRP